MMYILITNKCTRKQKRRVFMSLKKTLMGLMVGSLVLSNFAVVNVYAENEEEKELTIACIPGPVAERLKGEAEKFEELNEGVTVNVVEYPEATYGNQFPQILSQDESKPDLAWFWVGYPQYNKLVEAGTFLELDSLYESEGWNDVISQSTLDSYTAPDGHKYAVNTDVNWCQVIYINQDIFDELGIEEIKTYDDFFDACDKITEAGYVPFSIGIPAYGPQCYRSIVQTTVSEEQYNGLLQIGNEPEGVSYDMPEMVDAWEIIQKMGEKAFAKGVGTMQDDQARALFVQGKAAMYASGSWAASDSVLYNEMPEDFNISFMFYPQYRDDVQPKVNLVDCNGLMIPKGTGNEELAQDFLRYVMSYDGQKAVAEAKAFFPSRTDLTEEDLSCLHPLNIAMYQKMNEEGASPYWGISTSQVVWDGIASAMQQVIDGTMTPEEAAQSIQKIMDEQE